jgi:hypothetical protein
VESAWCLSSVPHVCAAVQATFRAESNDSSDSALSDCLVVAGDVVLSGLHQYSAEISSNLRRGSKCVAVRRRSSVAWG